MLKKLYSFSFYFICFFALIFPFSFILINNILNLFISLIVVSILIFLYFKIIKNIKVNISNKNILLILFCLCLLVRLAVVFFLCDNMIQASDFNAAFKRSIDLNYSGDYYRVFSHWILYPFINHLLYQFFGASQLTAQIFNSILVSFIPVLLYLVTFKITNRKSISILSSAFYIFWPSTILYVTIFTPDHYAALLLLFSVYMFLRLKNNEQHLEFKNIIISIVIGTFLGISTFFKNFASIYLIAILIIIILEYIKNKKIIFQSFLFFLIMLFSFSISKGIILNSLEKMIGNSIGNNIIPCYLNVGLNFDSNGMYDPDSYQIYFDTLKDTNYDFNKTNEIIMLNVKNKISYRYKEIPNLFNKKAKVIFQKDDDKLSWVKNSINLKQEISFSQFIENNLSKKTNIYYLILIIGSILGIFYTLKSKNENSLFIILCIVGVALELLLVEAQERYRYAIEPMFCILSGLGLYYLKKKVGK